MEYKEVIELIRYCQYNGDCEKCKLYLPRENICMDAHDIVTHSVILEHYDKYKWHNLRENPEDLPSDFSKVLVCFRLSPKMNIYEVCLYKNGYFCMSFGTRASENRNVLGWREVEPFPFEED